MAVSVVVRRDSYADSVALMGLSQRLQALPGVRQAYVVMGTEMNRQMLDGVGLLTPEAAQARAVDLIIAVEGDAVEAALLSLDEGAPRSSQGAAAAVAVPRTVEAAVRLDPGLNLALISVPGAYAAREARAALHQGLHVMLFSDNVPVEAEVSLKRLAHERRLLLMGPDCGTAIIDGVGLGFANAVRRGNIGIVAASGTGAQEISCLIDRLGGGVSQLIGVGGRDLSGPVGGQMTLDALERLQTDSGTDVIVLVSKPPDPTVAGRLRQAALRGRKPVVICLLGGHEALTLDEAAMRALALATGLTQEQMEKRLGRAVAPVPVAAGRRGIRGLFCGGTLCQQALQLVGGDHEFIDLGGDQFTVGRSHPMIDPSLRCQYLREASAAGAAAVLLDVVLGYGAHPDPAGALAEPIAEAVAAGVAVVASVTGTEQDPQRLSVQAATLRRAGAAVLPTARQAALTAAASVRDVGGDGHVRQ